LRPPNFKEPTPISGSPVISERLPYRVASEFETEIDACNTLEGLLVEWFELEREVEIEYREGQRLRIDYLVWPKDRVGFPYPHFGVEVKRGNYYGNMGAYIRALKQAIDYTDCRIKAGRFSGQRIDRVFVFPGADDSDLGIGWAGGVNRLAGLFHVGMIYQRRPWPEFSGIVPYFYLSAARVGVALERHTAVPSNSSGSVPASIGNLRSSIWQS
jgi:hypothetical protein